MKTSQRGIEKVKARIDEIVAKLNFYVGQRILKAEQREDFRDLQEELRTTQRLYRIFSDPESGK